MNVFNSLGSNYDLAFALRAEFALGSTNKRRELVGYLSKRYGGKTILTYKGRDAISISLKALLQGTRDARVVINGFTCIALYDAVVKAGAAPVLLDIEKDALDFSTRTLEEALTRDASIKAVIIQNTLGFPCEGKEIVSLCKRRGVALVEDLAHCVGATYADGSEAGTLGDATVLSFGQDKAVDAISGGALVIRDAKYAEMFEEPENRVPLIRQLKDRFYPRFTWDIRMTYPWYGRFEHALLRTLGALPRPLENTAPYTLPNWYAPLILRQLAHLPRVCKHRRRIAEIYARALDRRVCIAHAVATVERSANLRFPVVVDDRAGLVAHLRACGIHVSDTWYDAPIAPKKYAERIGYKRGMCPNAEDLSEHIVNLPTHINVSTTQAMRIAAEVNAFLKKDYGTHR